MENVTWSAKNNSSFLNGERKAASVAAAVRAGRNYIRGELYGTGVVTVFVDGLPVRQDEISMFTKYQWATTTEF